MDGGGSGGKNPLKSRDAKEEGEGGDAFYPSLLVTLNSCVRCALVDNYL